MTTTTRDMQKAKLYRAERRAFGIDQFLIGSMPLAECEAFIRKVCDSAWFQSHYGRMEPRIKDGRGTSIARGSPDAINLPRWARNRAVILHEIAHGATRLVHGSSVAGHGWEFASTYLALVQHVLGKDMARRLAAEFKKEHVRTAAKRTRPMSEEAKAILRARLAGYRAAAAARQP